MFIDFEDTAGTLVERLRLLGVRPEDINEGLTYLGPEGPFDDEAQIVMKGIMVDRGEPHLVIIDGVTEAMAQAGLQPNDGVGVAEFYAGFPRWLARSGAAVVLVDHVTKSTEGRGRFPIGSERKLSGIDGAAYLFTRTATFGRGRVGRVTITVSKDRHGHVRRHEGINGVIATMVLDATENHRVEASMRAPHLGDDPVARPVQLMEAMSQAIEEEPGINSRGVRNAVDGNNDMKDQALSLLVEGGFVAVDPGPNRAHLHRSLKPFRVADQVQSAKDD